MLKSLIESLFSFLHFFSLNLTQLSIETIMLLKDFLPQKGLQEFVRCYRIVHFNFNKNETPPVKPYTPRPENCIAFYPFATEKVEYADGSKKISDLAIALIGQHVTVTNRSIGHEFLVIQIIFQPGALYRLTGIPLVELIDEYMQADYVFAKDISFVNEQFHHAKSYMEMIKIANEFVTRLVKKAVKDAHPLDDICKLMLVKDGSISLDWLARESCLSIKQFERKFKDRTGVNPKLFSRLIRFDNAFRTKNAKPSLDWLSIAIDCNYYDYQHLVRDYKDFTGYSPTVFHALDTPEGSLGMSEGFYEIEMLQNSK
jgi:AraC-like DNA-binding protein